MYCPKCAQSSTADQRFCRYCGFNLQEVAPLLDEILPTAESNKAQLEKRLTRVIGWAVLFSFLWILLLAALDIPGIQPPLKKIASYLGLICFGLAIVLSLYAGIRWWWLWQFGGSTPRRQSQSTGLSSAARTTELPQVDITEGLLSEAHLEPVPSVTEHTTELLKVKKD